MSVGKYVTEIRYTSIVCGTRAIFWWGLTWAVRRRCSHGPKLTHTEEIHYSSIKKKNKNKRSPLHS